MDSKLRLLGFNCAVAILFALFSLRLGAQITGPADIMPGGMSQQYNYTGIGFNLVWSSTDANVVFHGGTSAATATVSVGKGVTACQIQLSVKYEQASLISGAPNYTATTSSLFDIDPFLTGSSTILPGQSITITNQDNCLNHTGHNNCLWNWTASDANALFCGGNNCTNNTLNTAVITCPNVLPAAVINTGTYLVTCNKHCGGLSYQYVSQMTITVVLQNPTITGLQSVACNNVATNNIIYTASADPNASFYLWTLPPNWTFNGSSNGNVISVNTDGQTVGNIKVRAFAANGSPVKSGLVSFPVVCCINSLPVSSNVSTGSTDKQQAASSIQANNTISSGGTAEYHAMDLVKLSNGFSAKSGCYFHGYLQGCTGSYFRIMGTADGEGDGENSSDTGTTNISLTHVGIDETLLLNNPSDDGLSIFPNPTSGNLNIKVSRSQDIMVSVQNVTGIILLQEKMKAAVDYNQNQINLADFADGIYLLRIKDDKGKQIKTEKVIVQR